MDKQTQRLISQGAIAAFALTIAGLLVGLKRLVWGLWTVVSFAWVLVWLIAMPKYPHTDGFLTAIYLVIAFLPPFILYVVLRVLSSIADGVRGVATEAAGSGGRTIDQS